jgi:hypothetical protein
LERKFPFVEYPFNMEVKVDKDAHLTYIEEVYYCIAWDGVGVGELFMLIKNVLRIA